MQTAIITLVLILVVGLFTFWTTATVSEADPEKSVPTVIVRPATPEATP